MSDNILLLALVFTVRILWVHRIRTKAMKICNRKSEAISKHYLKLANKTINQGFQEVGSAFTKDIHQAIHIYHQTLDKRKREVHRYKQIGNRYRGVYRWHKRTSFCYQIFNLKHWKFHHFYPDLDLVVESIFHLENPRRS